MPRLKAALLSELGEGQPKTVVVDGRTLALCRVGGSVHALDNACPHKGGPLGEGSLEGACVTCPWHGWKFDVTTGSCDVSPRVVQKTYPVSIEGQDVLIEVA